MGVGSGVGGGVGVEFRANLSCQVNVLMDVSLIAFTVKSCSIFWMVHTAIHWVNINHVSP